MQCTLCLFAVNLKMNPPRLLLILFCSLFSPLHATYHLWFHAGPEAYHFSRLRPGGTKQTGEIDGVRLGFDRIKPY